MIGAIVAVGAIVAYLNGGNHIGDVAIGECFMDPGTVEIGDVDVVDCSESHDYELYAEVTVTGFGDSYPGLETLSEWADLQCAALWGGYVDSDFDGSDYWGYSIVPSGETWASGDRSALCTVYFGDIEGHLVGSTGSVRKTSTASASTTLLSNPPTATASDPTSGSGAASRDVAEDEEWRQYCTTDGARTHVISTWKVNDIVLDGFVAGPVEWSEAEPVFLPLQPAWGDTQRYEPCATFMTTWFMNDDTWLYGLYYVAWVGDVDPDDSGGILLFGGDADFGSVPNSSLGEYSGPWDAYGWDESQWFGDLDATPPGTSNIEGTGSYDGTGYWFEWRKSLDSGDGRDWVLQPGQRVGDLMVNFWDDSERRSYEHLLTMTLATEGS